MADINDDYDDAFSTPPPKGSNNNKPRNLTGGIGLAVTYLGSIVLILYIFKRYYYSSKKQQKGNKTKWLGRNSEKEEYIRLCQIDVNDDETLKSALMKRATSAIRRMWHIQEDRDSLYSLMKSGALSEDAWKEFKDAEKEMEMEFLEIQAEAETFKEGWSQTIVKEAVDLCRLDMMRQQQIKTRETQGLVSKEEQNKLQKQREHEERLKKEQDEKARKMAEKYISQFK